MACANMNMFSIFDKTKSWFAFLGHFRILMRRDKTLKVCANHFVRPWMILQPMKGSNDKAWMYQVHADFAGSTTSSTTTK